MNSRIAQINSSTLQPSEGVQHIAQILVISLSKHLASEAPDCGDPHVEASDRVNPVQRGDGQSASGKLVFQLDRSIHACQISRETAQISLEP